MCEKKGYVRVSTNSKLIISNAFGSGNYIAPKIISTRYDFNEDLGEEVKYKNYR